MGDDFATDTPVYCGLHHKAVYPEYVGAAGLVMLQIDAVMDLCN